ncbi:hypothetical protein BC830DRAFT_1087215 [Chytriomyces sp. MP71]|nr:hypothetical protein BC830DRAFT_1087215 [Chytriomyces sp. MP71]
MSGMPCATRCLSKDSTATAITFTQQNRLERVDSNGKCQTVIVFLDMNDAKITKNFQTGHFSVPIIPQITAIFGHECKKMHKEPLISLQPEATARLNDAPRAAHFVADVLHSEKLIATLTPTLSLALGESEEDWLLSVEELQSLQHTQSECSRLGGADPVVAEIQRRWFVQRERTRRLKERLATMYGMIAGLKERQERMACMMAEGRRVENLSEWP